MVRHAMMPLRVGLAIVFLYTGQEKLLQTEANAAIVAYMGLPAPSSVTRFVGVVEVLGGLAIFAGLGARISAAVLSSLLAVILVWLKVPGGFWGDGWGIDVAVLSSLLTLALHGPGHPTLTNLLRREEEPEGGSWRRAKEGRKEEAVDGPGQSGDGPGGRHMCSTTS